MKIILILINIILATIILVGGTAMFRNISAKPEAGFTVKKRDPAKKKAVTEVKKTAPLPKDQQEQTIQQKTEQIISANIFNQERCPNAFVFGGNARVELTLVGTFKIGEHSGAVILQKNQNRNFPPFMMPGMNMAGRRQGIASANFRQNTQAITTERRRPGGATRIQSQRDAQGVIQPGSTTATAANQQHTYRQYVRVGETLSNGYTLVSVERNRAILTRGSDKLELELIDASQNAPKTARRAGRPNQTQIMQQMLNSMRQMQRMQSFQNFQMMRNMRQNSNSGRNTGTAPRRR